MGRLSRPQLPPGALAELVGELHALHARAGRPSMRELAKEQGFSYATVHDLFTKTVAEPPRLPVLLAVVKRLATIGPRMDIEETLDRFDALWQAADAEPFEKPSKDSTATAEPSAGNSRGDGLATEIEDAEPDPEQLTVDVQAVLEPEQRADESRAIRSAGHLSVATDKFYFVADRATPLRNAAVELRRAGYLAGNHPRDLNGRWSLKAYSEEPYLTDVDLATLDEIAERCGVDFDGWGTKSQLYGHTDVVNEVVTTELNGQPVAVSGSTDNTVWVWDVATRQPVGPPFAGHTDSVLAVTTAELNGRPVVISGGADQAVRVWDLATREPVGPPFGHSSTVNSVTTAQLDGRPVVISGSWNTVWVWDLATREPVGPPFTASTGTMNAVTTAQLNGQPVVITASWATVWVWDLATRQLVGPPFSGHTNSVRAVATAERNGRPVVISGGDDLVLRVWDLASRQPIGGPLAGHFAAVYTVVVTHLDRRPVVLSCGADDSVRRWDLTICRQIGSPFTGNFSSVLALATVRLDGRLMVISGGDRVNQSALRIWDLAAHC